MGSGPDPVVTQVGETNVRVTVNGTTFVGIYEVVGLTLELTSADFGDYSAALGSRKPSELAAELLGSAVNAAMRVARIPFLRDDGTVAPGHDGKTDPPRTA